MADEFDDTPLFDDSESIPSKLSRTAVNDLDDVVFDENEKDEDKDFREINK